MRTPLLLTGLYFFLLCSFTGVAQNIGIGTSNPTLAKLQINGTVGGSVAMFGADKMGVTISADNPEVGFNYFYNNGSRTIKTGYAALIGMSPGDGSLYLGNFNENQSAADLGAIVGYRTAMVIRQNGRIGIGVDNPARAFLEQNGSVGVNTALFGGDGKGVSLQKDWPALGLNHWFDGNHRSIGGGYGAQIGVNQSTGALYFAQFSNSAALPNGLFLNPVTAIHFRYGKIGLNTDDPQAALHVHNIINAYGNNMANSVNAGLRISTYATSTFWNIYNYADLLFSGNGVLKSQISIVDGAYYQGSDKRLKKQIRPLQEGALSKLAILNPVDYLMVEEDDASTSRHPGFVAQELEQVFPEVVRQSPGGMKMVNYAGLVPVLTKAIQEQQKIIEKQQQQIDWLMNKVQ